jgi:hypothetical protein
MFGSAVSCLSILLVRAMIFGVRPKEKGKDKKFLQKILSVASPRFFLSLLTLACYLFCLS